MTVELYKTIDGVDVLQSSTVTDENGNYYFDDLDQGEYMVRFKLPGGYTFVNSYQGNNVEIDSDVVDPIQGTTRHFTVSAKENVTNIDAGLRLSNNLNALIRSVNVYPNPAIDRFTIDVAHNNGDLIKAQLFDTYGRIVSEEFIAVSINSQSTTLEMNIPELVRGIYVVRIFVGDQMFSETIKLVD